MTSSGPDLARRRLLRSGCRHCAALATLGLAGVARGNDSLLPARFARPPADSEEGGLWALMDREERQVRRSPLGVRDPALTGYLRELVCRLAGEHCADLRVHVLRTPAFNALMAPNGMMQVWSGLLLRVDNEAQLAAVLGHELGHYLERHLLERMQDLKGKSAAATVFALFGLAGALATVGLAASLQGFSRQQEERADRLGMRLLLRAGYDGREAAQVWDDLLAELKVRGGEDVGRRSALFASHPPAAERRDLLLQLAGTGGGRSGAEALARVIAPHRLEWLLEEIQRGQFEESLALFDRKLRLQPDDPELLFARGEVRRLRDTPEDLGLALADLQRGAAAADPPALLFRSLGLLHRRRGEPGQAAQALRRYLAAAPQAGDAPLIHSYLTEVP